MENGREEKEKEFSFKRFLKNKLTLPFLLYIAYKFYYNFF